MLLVGAEAYVDTSNEVAAGELVDDCSSISSCDMSEQWNNIVIDVYDIREMPSGLFGR